METDSRLLRAERAATLTASSTLMTLTFEEDEKEVQESLLIEAEFLRSLRADGRMRYGFGLCSISVHSQPETAGRTSLRDLWLKL